VTAPLHPEPDPRVRALQAALSTIEAYARGALERLAATERRVKAGEHANPWYFDDVGRILSHVFTAAEQALAASYRPAPAPDANGKGGGA
jgi:hypothetical protein